MARAALRETLISDFTGGLGTAPPQELAPNEVAAARDVIFSARGGVHTRPGMAPFGATLLDPTSSVQIMTHVHTDFDTHVSQLFAIKASDGTLWWSDGSTWKACSTSGGGGVPITVGTIIGGQLDGTAVGVNGCQYLGASYFVAATGGILSYRWNGYIMELLGSAFDENIAAPSGLNMPSAFNIASKGDFVFIGDTYESGVRYRNRIRWCHPGRPTSWRTLDFIDVPRGYITALVPFRDYLAIFTEGEIYALYGDSTDTFLLQELVADSGTPFHWSVSASASTLYWWDWDQGLMALTTGKPFSVSDKIKPFHERDGFTWNPYAGPSNTTTTPPNVLWGEGRVYIAFFTLNQTVYPARDLGQLWVFDPQVGRSGAWTTFTDPNFTAASTIFVHGSAVFPRRFRNDLVVFGGAHHERIVNLQGLALDRNFTYGPTDKIAPAALVRTAPIAGESNVTKKRWRRPRVTFRSGGSNQTIEFGYKRDYRETNLANVHDIALDFRGTADADSLAWTDSFTDLFDTEQKRWTGFANPGFVGVSGGTLRFNVTAPASLQTSKTRYNFTGGGGGLMSTQVNAIDATAGATASWGVATKGSDQAAVLFFVNAAGTISMYWVNEAGTPQSATTVAYGVNTDWWRIRFVAGSWLWDTAPDGVTWTNRRTLANPFTTADFTAATFFYSVGCSTTADYTFDNFAFFSGVDTGAWNEEQWAADEASASAVPDNFVKFVTLPSGGSGNAFQMEFRSKVAYIDQFNTNDSWGIDSIGLPYREKGIR